MLPLLSRKGASRREPCVHCWNLGSVLGPTMLQMGLEAGCCPVGGTAGTGLNLGKESDVAWSRAGHEAERLGPWVGVPLGFPSDPHMGTDHRV